MKWLNDHLGGLLAALIVAVVGQSVMGYAKGLRDDDRWVNFERFAQQQQAMNDSQIKISESVAVMATRMNYVEKDLDWVFVNLPALSNVKPN